MGLIVSIDTSTTVCSVALAKDKELLVIKETDGAYTHAENLVPFIQKMMAESSYTLYDVDAIAVSKGPGSYTGLRIGVSTAKGLCYALNKPLLGINTLEAMTFSRSLQKFIDEKQLKKFLYCPMLDARRMEVYCALYNSTHAEIKAVNAEIIDEKSFEEYLTSQPVIFFGNGAAKCQGKIKHENALFVDNNIITSASNMLLLAEKALYSASFENIAYFEPLYVKTFVSKIPLAK